ncbi:hypothetical protein EUGRSUZ_F03938 [Eucalyptus grandis]|uniref:Uncharacterized protein n=2 Tax=Eucalyptus grandis TaxID=71139 RepID=A0ACC3KND5_EUCGR|nr:hypothetical protein EUGRSUZ_F03938 [Eucalyptus grandis]
MTSTPVIFIPLKEIHRFKRHRTEEQEDRFTSHMVKRHKLRITHPTRANRRTHWRSVGRVRRKEEERDHAGEERKKSKGPGQGERQEKREGAGLGLGPSERIKGPGRPGSLPFFFFFPFLNKNNLLISN